MSSKHLFPALLFIGGIVLLVIGIRETDSFSSQLSKFFTGSMSDRAIWMILGGVATIIVAASLSQISSKTTAR